MAGEDFGSKLKDMLSKGAEASKEAFSKAGNAVQTFSDKSLLKIEKQQIKSKLSKTYEALGEQFYLLLKNNPDFLNEIDVTSDENTAILDEIRNLQKQAESFLEEITRKDEAIDSVSDKKD